MTLRPEPTTEERRLLRFLQLHRRERGSYPTNKVAAENLGHTNVEVGRMVYRLALRGCVERRSSAHGDYILTDAGRRWANREVQDATDVCRLALSHSAFRATDPCPRCGHPKTNDTTRATP